MVNAWPSRVGRAVGFWSVMAVHLSYGCALGPFTRSGGFVLGGRWRTAYTIRCLYAAFSLTPRSTVACSTGASTHHSVG